MPPSKTSHLLSNKPANLLTQFHKVLDIPLDQCVEVLDLRGDLRRGRRCLRRRSRLRRLGHGRHCCRRAVNTLRYVGVLQGHRHVLQAGGRRLEPIKPSIVSMTWAGDLLHDLDKIERQSQPIKDHAAANENHTYRLMRVVKLCIWPPLAMSGNTLLRRSRKGAKCVPRQGRVSRL